MSKRSRRGYEFEKSVKEEERTSWRNRHPDQDDSGLEVHHILPIYKAKEYGVPKEAVKSRENAVALKRDFHRDVHRETDEETYSVLAEALKKLWLIIPIGGIIGIINYLANLR